MFYYLLKKGVKGTATFLKQELIWYIRIQGKVLVSLSNNFQDKNKNKN